MSKMSRRKSKGKQILINPNIVLYLYSLRRTLRWPIRRKERARDILANEVDFFLFFCVLYASSTFYILLLLSFLHVDTI